ncbi:MAG: nucleotidyl transferase AbiEii/AbiGii toxin family protein [Pirellulales bacterium]
MTDRQITNLAASVRQKLLNLSHERGEAFEYVLSRYGTERLLYRISQSQYADQFILKGAMLFQLWSDQLHRPTRDLDLLGHGEPSLERIAKIFAELCELGVDDDGLVFDPDSIGVEQIKEDDEYQGIRAKLTAYLENARVSLQVDIGFGDAINPPPQEIDYPTLLDQAAPRIKSYPKETVIAEKFQAMVMLGMVNSRMKDFFDLWTLATQFEFEGKPIAEAIQATFERRQTDLPTSVPLALTAEFAENDGKTKQWSAFLLRGNLQQENLTLLKVAELLTNFLMPPTRAITRKEEFKESWKPLGPWTAG